jgi:hypothetical protein
MSVSIYQAPEEVPAFQRASSLVATGIHRAALASPLTRPQRDTPPLGRHRIGRLVDPWTNCDTGPRGLRAVEQREFEALTDTEFVLGSAAPHEHDLILGHNSVYTLQGALRDVEAHISAIRAPRSRGPSVGSPLTAAEEAPSHSDWSRASAPTPGAQQRKPQVRCPGMLPRRPGSRPQGSKAWC